MKNLFLLLFIGTTLGVVAQPGANDFSFNPSDLGFGSGEGPDHTVFCSALLPDGKILIGGDFYVYNQQESPYLARVNPDGTLDSSFGSGIGPDGYVKDLSLTEDGKIIIGGNFTTYDGVPRYGIAQLNPDGSLDTSFDPGIGFAGYVSCVAVRPDGRIIVGGYLYSYNGVAMYNLIQLNPDGSVDDTFDVANGPDSGVASMALLEDGSLLIGGSFFYYDSTDSPYLAKILPDGSLDPSFFTGSGPSWAITAMAVAPNSQIYLGGVFQTYDAFYSPGLVRINADGSIDNTFSTGSGLAGLTNAIIILPDGDLLVGGYIYEYDAQFVHNIIQLNDDGSMDPTFELPFPEIDDVYELLLQPDMQVVVATYWDYYLLTQPITLFRMNPDGILDLSFNPQTGASDQVYAIETANDQIVIGGSFTRYDGQDRNQLARLNLDGSLVSTETTDFIYYSNNMLLQPDGKLLLAGYMDGTYFVRLNEDFTLDSTFNNFDGPDFDVFYLALTDDGFIYIGGYFTTIGGNPAPGLARLNPDGTFDPSFVITGYSGNIYGLEVQPDGKLMVFGYLSEINGTPINGVARLNPDGSVDDTFDPGTGPDGEAYAAATLPDGKILIGGNFNTFNGQAAFNLVRVNQDGTLDAFQASGALENGHVQQIIPQADGKIYIQYSSNFTEQSYFLRLNDDGSEDEGFDMGSGANGSVYAIALQDDGKLLIGGYFTAYDGIGRNRIARVHTVSNICAELDLFCRVDGQPIGNMKVELYKIIGTDIELQGAFSTTDAGGHAQYIDISEGEYLCRATPNADISGQENLLSTFTNETFAWQAANIITISCGMALNDTIDLIMLPAPGSFPGSATGTLRYMTDPPGLPVHNEWLSVRTVVTGDPIPGVPCILERDTTSAALPSGVYFPFQLSVSSASGDFEFGNLPAGHYRIYVDMPGLPMAETHFFNVTNQDIVFDNLNFYVDPNDAIYINDVISVGELAAATRWVVYPNPFSSALTLRSSGHSASTATYVLRSADGRPANSGRLSGDTSVLDFSGLAAGMYFLSVTDGAETHTVKVVKE